MQIRYVTKQCVCSYSECGNRLIEKLEPAIIIRYKSMDAFYSKTYHPDCYIESIKKRVKHWLETIPKPEPKTPRKRGRKVIFTDKEAHRRYRSLEVSFRYHRKKGNYYKMLEKTLEMIDIASKFRPLTLEEQRILINSQKKA